MTGVCSSTPSAGREPTAAATAHTKQQSKSPAQSRDGLMKPGDGWLWWTLPKRLPCFLECPTPCTSRQHQVHGMHSACEAGRKGDGGRGGTEGERTNDGSDQNTISIYKTLNKNDLE